ncbi:MAG: TetR/AcrR family transcriptional regulator [Desulfovibrio sp.]
MNRKDRRKSRHKKEILDAAMSVFLKKGYNATMREIAEESEFSVGTLYNFFEGKKELYQALMRVHADKIFEELSEYFNRGENDYARLVNFIRGHRKVLTDNARAVILYSTETKSIDAGVQTNLIAAIEERHEKIRERLIGVLASGMDNELFFRHDPEELAVLLEGAMTKLTYFLLSHPGGAVHEESTKMIEDFFFRGLLTEKGWALRNQKRKISLD